MHAATLSIGDELTLGQTTDSNAPWLAAQLAAMAILVVEHRTVGDDRECIAAAVHELAQVHHVLLITGGLGPTADDLTRHALGDVLTPGRPLMTDPIAVEFLESRYARRSQPMPPSNLVQTLRPESMNFLPNPNGTAMGLAGRHGSCLIFSLPGPPQEMQPMFRDHVAPALAAASGGDVLRTAMVRSLGLGESAAAERLGNLMDRDRSPLVGTTVSGGIVAARIRARGPAATIQREIDDTIAKIERRWHPYCFGRDEDSLPLVVGGLLRDRRATLLTAESCTGGLLGSMIVSIPGSSDYYLGGWTTYTNDMKSSQLGVPMTLIQNHGAVSEPVAAAMASGAMARAGASRSAEFSLAITGIAGPDGGSPDKPVGTVFIALAQRTDKQPRVAVRQFEFTGDRDQIRDRAAKSALQMLRWSLLNVGDDLPLLWERTRNKSAGHDGRANEPSHEHRSLPTTARAQT